MSDKIILAFSGKARSGKDSAAKTIISERGSLYKIATISFADALRQEVNSACDYLVSIGTAKSKWVWNKWQPKRLTPQQSALSLLCKTAGVTYDLNAVTEPNYPHSKQRSLLQWWGTEFRRAEDPNYWVNKWRDAVAASDADVILTTDLRFPNELEMVKSVGGTTIKFDRIGYVGLPEEAAAHVSENALNDAKFDHNCTVNDGDLDTLYWKALHVFDYIMHQSKFGW